MKNERKSYITKLSRTDRIVGLEHNQGQENETIVHFKSGAVLVYMDKDCRIFRELYEYAQDEREFEIELKVK